MCDRRVKGKGKGSIKELGAGRKGKRGGGGWKEESV